MTSMTKCMKRSTRKAAKAFRAFTVFLVFNSLIEWLLSSQLEKYVKEREISFEDGYYFRPKL